MTRDGGARAADPGQGRAHPRAGREEGAEWEMIPGGGKDEKEAEEGWLRRMSDDTKNTLSNASAKIHTHGIPRGYRHECVCALCVVWFFFVSKHSVMSRPAH